MVRGLMSMVESTLHQSAFSVSSWLHCAACGISVPPTGIEPLSPALEAWILNHLTAREVLTFMFCVLLLDQVQTGYADFS